MLLSQAPVVQPPDWSKVVPARLLCEPEAVLGGTELFNNRKGSLGNDIQRNEIPSLLAGTEILIPCGSFGIT